MISGSQFKPSAQAETIPVADALDLLFSYVDGEASVTGYEGTGKTVEIPGTVLWSSREYAVTSIADGAFKGCAALEAVLVPGTVTAIGAGAFDGCTSLRSLDIPESVSSIGDRAFRDCTSLPSVHVPRAVEFVGKAAFERCRLKNISVDPGNTHYCSQDGILFDKGKTVLIAYPARRRVRAYEVPGTVVSIAESAFYRAAVSSAVLPEGLVSIGDYAFFDAGDLESVKLPESLVSIGRMAFAECHSLESISIPKAVSIIGPGALSNRYLRHIAVSPDNPCFSSDKGVLFDKDKRTLLLYPPDRRNMMYKIPDTVEIIRTLAFSNCSNLEVINIPSSVKVLEKDAAAGYFSPPVRVPKSLYVKGVFGSSIDVSIY